jgi:hypothetical protein
MVYDHHFETKGTGGKSEAERLATLLAELHRAVEYLDLSIETEINRAKTRGSSLHGSPPMTRLMENRRSNLKVTIAALEERLADQLLGPVPA